MSHHEDQHASMYPEPNHVPQQRLKVLGERVAQSIADTTPEAANHFVDAVIRTAIDTFVSNRGHVAQSVRQLAPLALQVGIREATESADHTRLEDAFKVANAAVQRGLPLVVGDMITRDALQHLRQDLVRYISQLYRIARNGYERTSKVVAMSQEERLTLLRAAIFNGATVVDIEQVAAVAGFNAKGRYWPLIAVHGELSESTRNLNDVLVSSDGSKALVPESREIREDAGAKATQVVYGPPTTLRGAHEAVVLASKAAALLHNDVASDQRRVVPVDDLLSELLVRGNPLLTDLLVRKHLAVMEELPVRRRLELSEMLLLSLERGIPLNRVARDLGIASQTAHNRMKSLRQLLGDKLDDADQRLELIVALRVARERWAGMPSS